MNRIARIVRNVAVFLVAITATACIVPPQQQQPGYAQPQAQQQARPLPPAGERTISINGRAASAQDLQTLEQLEMQWGVRLPSGSYWYDNASGAAGPWGGPTGGFVQAGLGLGGVMPANASGGGNGNVTNVFINGRELHPRDVQGLQGMIGQVYQGRWFVDAYGNFGQEGGAVLGNLLQIAQANGKQGGGSGGDSYYRKDDNGSAFVGGGCVAISTKSSPSVDKPDIDYYSDGC